MSQDKKNPYYNHDGIKRFVDGVSNNQREHFSKFPGKKPNANDLCTGISVSDISDAANALAALIYAGVDIKKELGITQKRGVKPFKIEQTIHSPKFPIVLSFAAGEIRRVEAIKYLMDDFNISESSATTYIENRRGLAEEMIKAFSPPYVPEWFKIYFSREEILAAHEKPRGTN